MTFTATRYCITAPEPQNNKCAVHLIKLEKKRKLHLNTAHESPELTVSGHHVEKGCRENAETNMN